MKKLLLLFCFLGLFFNCSDSDDDSPSLPGISITDMKISSDYEKFYEDGYKMGYTFTITNNSDQMIKGSVVIEYITIVNETHVVEIPNGFITIHPGKTVTFGSDNICKSNERHEIPLPKEKYKVYWKEK
ncbi:MAG: hypothetical protein LBP34_07235 [Flavobacteriaceae bacterium]|jgi:hypothetical protein|nr:hypothetical protein [Flavobacteriaceae bacterium]